MKSIVLQWQIQDFPDGGANPGVWSENLLLDNIFVENCMKMKEIGLRADVCCTCEHVCSAYHVSTFRLGELSSEK